MADGFISGSEPTKKLQTYENTVGGEQVHSEAVTPTDPSGAPYTDANAFPVKVTENQPNAVVVGGITALGQSVTLVLPNGGSASGVQFSGTFVGTVVFEASNDGGTTYSARQLRTSGILNRIDSTVVNGTPTNWRGNVGGLTHFRVRCTAYTSGTLSVSINADSGVGGLFLLTPAPIGGVSTANAINGAVGSGVTVPGVYEQMTHVASVNIALTSTQSGTLTVDYSNDGMATVQSVVYPVTAGQAFNRVISPRGEWLRVNYTNTGLSSATVTLEVAYRNTAVQTPLLNLGDEAPVNALAAVTKAVIQGINSWSPVLKSINATPQRVDSGMAGRKSVTLRARNFNTNGDQIFVGSSNAVSSNFGVELKERESITLDLAPGAQVWAVGSVAGPNPLEVIEAFDA